jgi:hypothetical protein
MEVKTKADKTVSMGEQATGEPELGFIAEMVTDAARLDQFIPGASAKGAALAQSAEDDKPEFPVVRVESGWSRSRRLWTGEQVTAIADQVNQLQPVGHLGHIKDEDEATAFPEPQTTWFAATTKTESSQQKDRIGEQITVAYFAGYNLPGASVRRYIRSKAVRGVSWWGRGEQVPIPGQGVEVRGFVLKSLDWARKLSEGMPSSSVVAVTGEQETNMAKELSQVTPEEFKAENPNGYALLVTEATAEKDKTIGEQEAKITEGEEAKSLLTKLCEAIGIDDPAKLLQAVTDLKTRIGDKAKLTTEAALDKLLAEKVPDESKRALVKRLLPVGEMELKVADAKDAEEADKLIGEMVDKAFNDDDTIQTVIGEMQAPVVRRREDLSRTGSNTDAALKSYGVERERVTLGS